MSIVAPMMRKNIHNGHTDIDKFLISLYNLQIVDQKYIDEQCIFVTITNQGPDGIGIYTLADMYEDNWRKNE